MFKEEYLYYYKIQVLEVIDGDTLWVNIDKGFQDFSKRKIRLYGLDAPEIDTEEGQKSFKWLKERLNKEEYFMKSHKDKNGVYGRVLGVIFEIDKVNTKSINREMIDLGLAEFKYISKKNIERYI